MPRSLIRVIMTGNNCQDKNIWSSERLTIPMLKKASGTPLRTTIYLLVTIEYRYSGSCFKQCYAARHKIVKINSLTEKNQIYYTKI